MESVKRITKKIIKENDKVIQKEKIQKRKKLLKNPKNKGKKFRRLNDFVQDEEVFSPFDDLKTKNKSLIAQLDVKLQNSQNDEETLKQTTAKIKCLKKPKRIIFSSDDHSASESSENVKIVEKNDLFLSKNMLHNIKYYESSKSDFIKIGKYILPTESPSTCREIHLTCRHFSTIVQEKGWVNGLIIDAYNTVSYSNWDNEITFFTTDDTHIIIGDYNGKRRLNSFAIYDLRTMLKNVLIFPYVMNFHWRVLIANIKERSLTLLDPYADASDLERACDEFEIFLKICKNTSTFASLKHIKWIRKVFRHIKPHQSLLDYWSCRVFIIYYIKCIASGLTMCVEFDPQEFRKEVAETLIKNLSNLIKVCKYCLKNIKELEETTFCSVCSGEMHNMCIIKGDANSDSEVSTSSIGTYYTKLKYATFI